ncbi:hypothetical protein DFQ01_105157 [Paenibacillus cellulosilyticus]|uniref:histidine kinase n=1 Tax=Paenibacillus cellulosilyticus TaxID=375489 RepID=A0A2V2YV56_9BACL|nr:sensor histidine kinase [Paenibacillus cellulosilyticus]PWW05173.1 hypothetical protein DFQ01_105157 [Paenibacillus cellulosilyticus]
MSWMGLLRRTLSSERRAIIVYLINTAMLLLIFNLMMDEVSVVYPLSVSLTILIIYLGVKTYALFRFEDGLAEAKEVADFQEDADHEKDKLVFHAIRAIHTDYLDKLVAMNEKLDGRNSLFSHFIHNMKSSLAVIELASHKRSDEVLADIASENEKLKTNMEQLLNLLRLDEFTNDYVPERADLLEIVQAVINDKRRSFIYSSVYPKVKGQSAYVYTDRKWCSFILDQIVTNAIKYSPQGRSVYFEIVQEEDVGLTSVRVRDEGEGIDPEDLPRVFELFYTGKNGRSHKQATGIGLAMVRHTAKRLGHEVSLTSKLGEGTCVTISFLSKLKAY